MNFGARKEKPANPAMAGHQWTMGNQLASVASTVVLWIAIALGPIAFAMTIWQVNDSASAVPTEVGMSAEVQAEQLVAGEFATRVITVWLTASRGQEDLVHALLPAASSQLLPPTGMTVADTMPVAYTSSGDGVWTVTVAASVTDARMTARRFFTLPVKVVPDSAVVAIAMPAEVPSTAIAASPPALDYSVAVPTDSPVVATSGEFLAAYLTGVGDVARVVTPNAPIMAVRPAPYTAIQTSAVAAHSDVPSGPADGTQIDVLVTAVAWVGTQQQTTMQYPLTLTARAGRWEVSQVRPSPLLTSKQSSFAPSAAPAVTSSPTPTTTSTPSTPK